MIWRPRKTSLAWFFMSVQYFRIFTILSDDGIWFLLFDSHTHTHPPKYSYTSAQEEEKKNAMKHRTLTTIIPNVIWIERHTNTHAHVHFYIFIGIYITMPTDCFYFVFCLPIHTPFAFLWPTKTSYHLREKDRERANGGGNGKNWAKVPEYTTCNGVCVPVCVYLWISYRVHRRRDRTWFLFISFHLKIWRCLISSFNDGVCIYYINTP